MSEWSMGVEAALSQTHLRKKARSEPLRFERNGTSMRNGSEGCKSAPSLFLFLAQRRYGQTIDSRS